MNEIERRRRQRRHRQVMINRCIVAVVGILLIVLIVCGIRGCVNRGNKANEVQVTATPEPTATPLVSNRNIDQDFFADSCFIGNSFVDSMEIYELIDGADYFGKVGISVNQADTVSMDNSSVALIDELNTNKNYERIFMMFGENELGWSNMDKFVSEYKSVVKTAKKYQPDAKIYLLSVPPVSAEVDEKDENGINNENIVKINKLIKQVAADSKVFYCDIYSAVVNSKNQLPDSAATDGIHFDRSYYEKCLVYIQKNYENGEPSPAPSSSASDSDSSSSSNSSAKSDSSSSSSNKSSSSTSSSSSNKSSSSTSSSSSNKSSSSSSSSSGSNKSSSSSGNSSSTSSSSSSAKTSAAGSSGTDKSSSSSSSSTNKSSSSSSSNKASSVDMNSDKVSDNSGKAASKDLND